MGQQPVVLGLLTCVWASLLDRAWRKCGQNHFNPWLLCPPVHGCRHFNSSVGAPPTWIAMEGSQISHWPFAYIEVLYILVILFFDARQDLSAKFISSITTVRRTSISPIHISRMRVTVRQNAVLFVYDLYFLSCYFVRYLMCYCVHVCLQSFDDI